MNFLHARVHVEEGGAVDVKLHGAEANIRVMDDINFRRCRSGDGFKYYGGHYRQSAIIHPPSGGDWNVVIDDDGEVTASVHVADETTAEPQRGGDVEPHLGGILYRIVQRPAATSLASLTFKRFRWGRQRRVMTLGDMLPPKVQ
jgi:hypothetical protein